MLSGFPSTDFGAAALMSTPPNPMGLPSPTELVVATVAVAVVAVAALGAPNPPPKPPPSVNVGAADVLAVGAADAPKVKPAPGVGAATCAAAPGSAKPVDVVVDVAGVVDVPPPKLKAGVAAAMGVAKVVAVAAGFVDIIGTLPNANPVVGAAAAAAIVVRAGAAAGATAVVAEAGVPKANAGALVVGVPKLKPDMVVALPITLAENRICITKHKKKSQKFPRTARIPRASAFWIYTFDSLLSQECTTGATNPSETIEPPFLLRRV